MRFASNQKQQQFTLTAAADDLAEEGEKVIIALGRLPSRVTRGQHATTQVVIADVVAEEEEEESVPDVSVSLSPVSLKVSEAAGTVQFTVSLSQVSSQQVTVRYATATRTATAGEDYRVNTGTLTFPAGTTEQTFGVRILDDAVEEEEEMFQVLLRDSNATIATGTATVVITDNDATETETETEDDQQSLWAAFFNDLYGSGKRAALPDSPQLEQNAPNPFNSETVLAYFLPEDGPVRLEVFSLTGQRVSLLYQGPQQAGYHWLRWHGRDDQGHPVASGMYLYRLVTDETVLTRKLMLLR